MGEHVSILTYQIFYFGVDFDWGKSIMSGIFIFYYIGMCAETARNKYLKAENSGDFYSNVKDSINNFYEKNFSDNGILPNKGPVLIVKKLCEPFTNKKEITDINSFFNGINKIFDDEVVKNAINNIKPGNSQEFESFSKVLVGLLNCIIDAEDKCGTGLLGRQTWSGLIFGVLGDKALAKDFPQYYEKKTGIAKPDNSYSEWIITPDYSNQIKTFYNNVKKYLINGLEKYNDTCFYLHQDGIRIFPDNIFSKKITSANILLRVKNYLKNLDEEPQKISYTIWDDFKIKYGYGEEIKNNFINQSIKILGNFRKSLEKIPNNINLGKNNGLVGIIILCEKLEIDLNNSETQDQRISIIKTFSDNLAKKLNAIPDEFKTQIENSKEFKILKNFLSDASNAKDRIKNK